MRQLFKILSNEELLEKLAHVSSPQELAMLDDQYLGG